MVNLSVVQDARSGPACTTVVVNIQSMLLLTPYVSNSRTEVVGIQELWVIQSSLAACLARLRSEMDVMGQYHAEHTLPIEGLGMHRLYPNIFRFLRKVHLCPDD